MSTNTILNVTAGSTVNAIWRHTLTSDASDVMDASHKVRICLPDIHTNACSLWPLFLSDAAFRALHWPI